MKPSAKYDLERNLYWLAHVATSINTKDAQHTSINIRTKGNGLKKHTALREQEAVPLRGNSLPLLSNVCQLEGKTPEKVVKANHRKEHPPLLLLHLSLLQHASQAIYASVILDATIFRQR
jgi:hypothetical protein